MATMTAQAFNRDVSEAKRLAEEDGPLFITHRGETKFVLLTLDDYERLKPTKSLLESLMLNDGIEIDLMDYIPPRSVWDDDSRIPDFSE